MITEATPQELIATIRNARPLSEASFEEGCTVLDAIEKFDRLVADGSLGTWLEYSGAGRNALRFVPVTDEWNDPHTHRLVGEKLAEDSFLWTFHQPSGDLTPTGTAFAVWVVIDRATRALWVEHGPIMNQHVLHPRALHEAGEFPSSSRGTVSTCTSLRVGEAWRDVLIRMLEAYYQAKDLLDHYEGCDHHWNQDESAALKMLSK